MQYFLLSLIIIISVSFQPLPCFSQESSPQEAGYETVFQRSNLVTSVYKIAPGDILTFSINEEPDFNQQDIIVQPDGYVTIRPLGLVKVAEKTITELTGELEAKLVTYINNPQVYLNIQKFNSPTVYLFGAVSHPGPYQLSKKNEASLHQSSDLSLKSNIRYENFDLSIMTVLVNAGGVKHTADLTKVKITGKNRQTKVVNLLDLIVKGKVDQDLILESGDAVEISEFSTCPYDDETFKLLTASGIFPEKFPVRVLGEAVKPGLYYLSSDSPYLNTALSLAEGFQERAIRNNVLIYRKSDNNQGLSVFKVNAQKIDIVLRPNDVIEIGCSKRSRAAHKAESAARIIYPFSNPITWLLRSSFMN